MKTDHRFLHGFRQRMLHARVALHVAGRAFLDVLTLRMAPWRLPVYLRRASLFLRTLRHGKVAVRNGRYKLHLYFPANHRQIQCLKVNSSRLFQPEYQHQLRE